LAKNGVNGNFSRKGKKGIKVWVGKGLFKGGIKLLGYLNWLILQKAFQL